MKLSTKGRYAVMAMVDLAMHQSGEPIALSDIASRQSISLSYLEQLFGKLRRAGLVKSVRGPGGGYNLAHTLGQIRIADIVIAVDEPLRASRCRVGSPTGCQGTGSRCITHDLWEELTNHIFLFLNFITLDDVINKRILGISGALFQRENPVPELAYQDIDVSPRPRAAAS